MKTMKDEEDGQREKKKRDRSQSRVEKRATILR